MNKKLFLTLVLLCIFLLPGIPVSTLAKAEDKQSSVSLPVVMYHNIHSSKKSVYTVTCSQFENDLIAFKNAGYTTVFPSEVIAFVNGSKKLPDKPLIITFDDGRYNNMLYAFPLLKKYNQKAVINIIGAFSEFSTSSGDDSNPNYSHLTWPQIKELADSGCFEIGNHTYNMHQFKPRFGVDKELDETVGAYKENISNDIMRLQKILKDKCKVTCNVFAYPFGKYNDISKEILLKLGFKMLFTCNEGINTIKAGEPDGLHYLKRINRDCKYTSEELLKMIKT